MKKSTSLVMSCALLVIALVLSLFTQQSATAADNSPGTACKKLGATANSGTFTVECKKVSGKLVWAKVVVKPTTNNDQSSESELAALRLQVQELMSSVLSLTQRLADSETQLAKYKTPGSSSSAGTTVPSTGSELKCVVGGSCPIGSTGPGGGVIFYDAGTQQSWGRYLEFAPEGWSGNTSDPTAAWCNITTVNFTETIKDDIQKATVGNEVGKGKANTNLMLIGCKTGAAVLAHTYSGGSKSDWFLPSRAELNEMCKYARSQPTGNPVSDCTPDGVLRGGFASKNYWSSSEEATKTNSGQNFGEGFVLGGYSKAALFYVRPIRAF